MKWLILFLLALILGVLVRLGIPALSEHPEQPPMPEEALAGLLAPCPSTDKCYFVTVQVAELAPNSAKESAAQAALENIKSAIGMTRGANIEYYSVDHLYATFRTPILGFIDDVECLLSTDRQSLQIKSSSRLGKTDFGANRKRIQALLLSLGLKSTNES